MYTTTWGDLLMFAMVVITGIAVIAPRAMRASGTLTRRVFAWWQARREVTK